MRPLSQLSEAWNACSAAAPAIRADWTVYSALEPAMPVLEDIMPLAERATGMARRCKRALVQRVGARTARAFRFNDDGFIPNHPHWPRRDPVHGARGPLPVEWKKAMR
jgi:hypothetical protein